MFQQDKLMESSSKATTSSTTPLNVAGYSFMRNYQNGNDRMSREGQLLYFLFQNWSLFFRHSGCARVYCRKHSGLYN